MPTKARFRWPGINELNNGGLRRLNEAGRNLEKAIGGHLGPRGDAYIVAQEFGAAGDGAHDDVESIQIAVNTMSAAGGGIVYLPPLDTAAGRYYRVNTPLVLPDNVILEGSGPDSLIYNDRTDALNIATHPTILFGWFIESYWPLITTYPLNNISEGDRIITFDTAADANNFAPDDLVAIRTAAETNSDEPLHTEVTEVVTVGVGTITVRDPVSEDMVDPSIWNVTQHQPTSPHTHDIRLVRRAGVRNIGVRSNQHWQARVGGYRCTVQNVFVDQSADLWNANLWTRGLVEHIQGRFFAGVVEYVAGHHSTIRGLRASYEQLAGGWSGNTGPLLVQGPATKNCLIEDFEIAAGDYDGDIRAIQFGGKNNTIRRGKIVSTATQRGIHFVNAGNSSQFNTDNTVQDVEFRMNTPVFFVVLGNAPSGTFDVIRPRVLDCRFYGTAATGVSHERCVDGRFEGNYIPSGNISFESGSAGNRWINNYVAAEFAGAAVGSNIIHDNVDDRSDLVSQIQQTSTNQAINSTTMNNVVGSVPIPAGALSDDEWLEIIVQANIGPGSTNGAKEFRIRLFDDDTPALVNTIATLSFAAGETGETSFQGRIYASNDNRLSSYIEESKAGVRTINVNNNAGLDLLNTNHRLDIEAWVANSLDTINLFGFSVRPYRPHYTGAY